MPGPVCELPLVEHHARRVADQAVFSRRRSRSPRAPVTRANTEPIPAGSISGTPEGVAVPRVQAPSTTGLKKGALLVLIFEIHKFEKLTQSALYTGPNFVELFQVISAPLFVSRKIKLELAARLSVVKVAFKVPLTIFGEPALVVVLLYRRDSEPVFDAVKSHAVIALGSVNVPAAETVMVPASDHKFCPAA